MHNQNEVVLVYYKGVPLNFFLEIGRNYVPIIITIVSNITVSWSKRQ